MSPRVCPFEPSVVRASHAGPLPETLRAHVVSCSACSAAMGLAALFALDRGAEASAEEATRTWQRGRAIAAFAPDQEQLRQQLRLRALDRLAAGSVRIVAALMIGEIFQLSLTGSAAVTPGLESGASFAAGALLVTAATLVGIWRRWSPG